MYHMFSTERETWGALLVPQTRGVTNVLTFFHVCGPLISGFEDDAGSRFGVDTRQEPNAEQSLCSKWRATLS